MVSLEKTPSLASEELSHASLDCNEYEAPKNFCCNTLKDYTCPYCESHIQSASPDDILLHLSAHSVKHLGVLYPEKYLYIVEKYILFLREMKNNEVSLEDGASDLFFKYIQDKQEQERKSSAKLPKQCIFCGNTFHDRYELFKHMQSIHRFNIGDPYNLVFVDEYLDMLKQKLDNNICLYCENTFKDPITLRKHMRNKQHYKIHAKNHVYDQFYLSTYQFYHPKPVNTLNGTDEDEHETQGSWSDWSEQMEESTICLFCDQASPTPEHLISSHLPQKHGFDLTQLAFRNHLNFYDVVRFINRIRSNSEVFRCCFCQTGESFGSKSELSVHLDACAHFILLLQSNYEYENLKTLLDGSKDDTKDFRPVIPDDPLLRAVDLCVAIGDDE